MPPTVLFRLNKNTKMSQLCIQFAAYIMLFIFLFSGIPAQAEPKKSYLRIEQNKSSDDNDLKITSIGGLIFDKDMEAHIDLTHLESDNNGKGLTLDFGGGYVFNWDVPLFFGIRHIFRLQLG